MTRFHSLLTSFFLLAGAVLPFVSASAATIEIDGVTYTQEAPYLVTITNSDDYSFTNGGWLAASTHELEFRGTFSGSGNLNVTAEGRNQVRFNNSMSNFSGTVNVSGQAWFSIRGSNLGSEKADFIVDTTNANDTTGLLLDNVVTSASAPLKIGSLSGNGCIRPMGNQNKVFYIEIGGNNHDAVYSGQIRTHNGDSVYVTKVGTGTWSLTGSNPKTFAHPVTVREGTLSIGNGGSEGRLDSSVEVIVEKNATLQYNRAQATGSSADRDETILLQGSTLKVIGGQKFTFTHLTVENGGNYSTTTDGTLKNLVLTYAAPTTGTGTGETGTGETGTGETGTSEVQDVRFTIDGSSAKVYLTGSLTGGDNQEIYFKSVRGNFLYLHCDDVSDFSGTITAGPSTNSTYGTWISLNGATTDFSTVTFNPNPGRISEEGPNNGKPIDSGFLINFDPTDQVLKIGAISGDGIFRSEGSSNGKTISIQVGAKNIDTEFSGSFSRYQNSNFTIEKIGTGTWTITSDYDTYYSNAPVGTTTKNNYTGNTVITGGTIQIGNGGTVGHLGTSTNSSQLTKIIIGENGTLAFNRSDVLQFYNNIQSSGTINVVGGEVALRGTTSGSIIKTGPGILAIGNDNGTNLTKITVKEGILDNYAASRLGDGRTAIVLDGGTFREKDDNVTLSNKFSFKSASTINIPENVTTYISSRIDDVSGQTGVLTKTGKGTLVFTGANEYTGGYIIEQGTIQCGNNDDGHINNSASVTLNSGTAFGYNRAANTSVVKPTNVFTVNGGKLFNSGARAIAFQNVTMQSGGLKLENTGTSTLEANVKASSNTNPGWLTFNGTTDGDITANVNGSSAAQYFGGLASANNVKSTINFTSSNRANFMNLRGDLSEFSGDINVSGNCWICFDSGTALGSEKASFNLNMTKDCGLLFESGSLNDKTIKIGDLTGTGWVRSGNGGANVTLEVGALENDSTFSGAFVNWQSRGLTVKKVGDGNWTFASANQVSGVDYANSANVVVDSGTLTLNRKANQASANNLTVNDDAILVVAGNSQKVSNLVTLNSGSVMELDVTGAALPSLTAKTIDIKDGSQIKVEFSDTANPFVIGTLELLTADQFQINGSPVTSDDAMKSLLETYVEVNADWALLSYIPHGTTGYTVLLQTNFNAIPEPSAWILALLGFAGLGVLRRRRFQRV